MLPVCDSISPIQDTYEMSTSHNTYLVASGADTSPPPLVDPHTRHRHHTATSASSGSHTHHDLSSRASDIADFTEFNDYDNNQVMDEVDTVLERETWASPIEFILSCLGYAVGLGNVWRFPYLCYENGGGAFLIPYAIMLCFVGIPVFFIELSVGQYSSSGPMTLWTVSPIFQGIGAGMIFVSFMVNIYYNMIIGWSIYYTYASFKSPLPWTTCNHTYNTRFCYSKTDAYYCENIENGTYINKHCYTNNETNVQLQVYAIADCDNCTSSYDWKQSLGSNQQVSIITESVTKLLGQRTGASEEYFNFGMLARNDSIDETGYLQGHLVSVLAIAWVICFLCVIRGIRSSGKVVYVTATFPYLVLFILFLRGITLPGAIEGIKFYILPDWSKLLTSKVWGDAAGQIFFSLGCSMGGLMTFASYNKFHNNIYRDTLIVSIGNCLTSFFAGFVIFSILGFMAYERNTQVGDVVKSGSALAFIAYPEVVANMPLPTLWSVLFFLMLITLGLDSQFASVECVLTAIQDTVPSLRRYKSVVSLCLCVVTFIIGLIMCSQSGIYWLEIMSYYAVGWSLVFIGLVEVIVFAWIYGAQNLSNDIREMTGVQLKIHWIICWKYITPVILIVILLMNFVKFTPLSVGEYVLPDWSQAIGWLMALMPLFVIVFVASYKLCTSQRQYRSLTLWQRLYKLSQPLPSWKKSNRRNKTNKAKIYTLSVENNVFSLRNMDQSNHSDVQFDV